MQLTLGSRHSGKTLELIKQSAEKGVYILVKNRQRALELSRQAKRLGYDIPFPITVQEVVSSSTKFHGSCIRKDGIYIDDAEDVLKEFVKPIKVHSITLTVDEKTKWLNANPKIKEERTCDNCTNKFLCPNANMNGACMGWGEREVFIGLVKLCFGMQLHPELIDEAFKHVEKIQGERKKDG